MSPVTEGSVAVLEVLSNHECHLALVWALAHSLVALNWRPILCATFVAVGAPEPGQLSSLCSKANIEREAPLWIARHRHAERPRHCLVVWSCIAHSGSRSNLETMAWTLPHLSCVKLFLACGVSPCRSSKQLVPELRSNGLDMHSD